MREVRRELLVLKDQVADLDPLGLDFFLTQRLPLLNKEKLTEEIIQVSKRSSEMAICALPLFNQEKALATTRDLGFLAASLVRNEVLLRDQTPQLEVALLVLSEKTGEPPRDTVYSYSYRNPNGDRMRTFTATPEERMFIEATQQGIESTIQTFRDLSTTRCLRSMPEDFGVKVANANRSFEKMVRAMVDVRKEISPEFFTNELRPFFPPMKVGDSLYFAPGGAQMPLLLVDMEIWGSDVDDPKYLAYLSDNTQYLPRELRDPVLSLLGQDSLITKMEFGDYSSESAREVFRLVNGLLRFRNPHFKTAVENMKIRPEGAKGSGGYDTEVLEMLVEYTHRARERVEKLLFK